MTWLVISLLLVASGALILWYEHTLREWDPSVVTSAIVLALTVSVVNLIFRRDLAARNAPRQERVLQHMAELLQDVVITVVADYTWNYLSDWPFPGDAKDMVELWMAERKAGNVLETRNVELHRAIEGFHNRLEYFRWRYADSLPIDLVDAMDDIDFALTPNIEISEEQATCQAMVALGRFIAVFGRYAPMGMGFTLFDDYAVLGGRHAAVQKRAMSREQGSQGGKPGSYTSQPAALPQVS